MTSTGLTEAKEIERLQKIIDDLDNSGKTELRLIYPAIKRRNNSGKITICGGSYNPVHNGHRELISRTLESVGGAEAVVFVTLKHSLNKKLSGASYAQRLYMLKMEQKTMPFVSIGIINDGFYRNWFHRLNEFHPGEKNTYFCALGSDLFPRIIEGNSEEDYPKIFSIDWIVAWREGKSWKDFAAAEKIRKYHEKIHSVKLPDSVSHLSSSGIKKLLNKRDSDIAKYLSESQIEFIKRNKIFF
ncbi:adenylyltransferase/cytidyltransferase family protein [Candidatus Woesearchaeota archaeon]|nr:adenylyltransferase/cytidyltransferase family protein [Candidatus Woesearchaeota archaeon]